MILSSGEDKQNIEYILNIINQYNRAKPDAPVKFIHAGTSADLAFIGKTARITRPKESEILMIPHAIIPKGILRKKYGIYPLLLENGFNHSPKKMTTNYHRLHGAVANQEGITTCYQRAHEIYPHMKGENIHKLILETIIRMHPTTYIRSLKRVLSLLNNLVLMDPESNDKVSHYLTLLTEEKKIVQTYYHDQEIITTTTFNKYLSRIENIIRTKMIPLQTDEKFRMELVEHFPIIYCSTVQGHPHEQGLAHERIYDDELYLETVKLVFTPSENLTQLQAKLEEIGLANNMKVHSYKAKKTIKENKDEDTQTKEKITFLNSVLLDQFVTLAQKNPHLMKDSKLLEEKLSSCFNVYSLGKGKNQLTIAAWLLKHADDPALEGIAKIMAEHPAFTLHEILQLKSQKNSSYLQTINTVLPSDYLNRLNEIAYLKALLELRKKDLLHLLNYTQKFSSKELFKKVHPKKLLADQTKYLYEYLLRLQSLYAVLSRDRADSIEYAENISFLLELVREKYIELINEYKKKNRMDSHIASSELFRLVKDSVQNNKKVWVRIFARTKTAANE